MESRWRQNRVLLGIDRVSGLPALFAEILDGTGRYLSNEPGSVASHRIYGPNADPWLVYETTEEWADTAGHPNFPYGHEAFVQLDH